MCELAQNTAVPAAKRSVYAGACGDLLSRATDTVTKPPPSKYRPPSPPARQPPVPDCVSGQLSARFVGGGYGGGNDFGVIAIWNPGTPPCRLHGLVTFAAYYADGSRDREAIVNRPPVKATTSTLPGTMPAPRDGQPAGYLVALMGLERDDPTQPNGLCRLNDEGTPASLELSIGSVSVHVPNEDSGSPQVTSIYGCHGSVALEDVLGLSS